MSEKQDLIERWRTERCAAERAAPAHLANWERLYTDERVMATLGGVWPRERVGPHLEQCAGHWREHGFGIWTFHLLPSGEFVGRAGLRRIEIDGAEEIELLYALMPEYWNQGFGTEMSNAILRTAFERIRISSVVAFTVPTNAASQAVMRKAGLTYEKNILHAQLEHVLFRITRAECP